MSQTNSLAAAEPPPIDSPSDIVQSVLDDLNQGRIAEVIARFHDHFIFQDHALGLDLIDRDVLIDFFKTARELFPDATVEVVSLLESGDRVVVEWRLTATENVVFWRQLRMPIVADGISSVRVENQRITHWSDYYDGAKARRTRLVPFGADWMES